MLASEYGWTKRYILEDVYIDDVFQLQRFMRIRQANKYKIELAIVQNPHISDDEDRRALWDILDSHTRDEDEVEEIETVDYASFEMFKSKVSENPRISVK